TFTRTGDLSTALEVNYTLSGTATNELDYQLLPTGTSAATLTIPAGAASSTLNVTPLPATNYVGERTLELALASSSTYAVGTPSKAAITIGGNAVPVSLTLSPNGTRLTWTSNANRRYQVAYKDSLTDSTWTMAGQITATNSTSSWLDAGGAKTQRFYLVAQVD
ncbi:MAG TPA: fibronectin type III domain-containing protein, partial [Clostridia bacterium]|nr:fibronectin type III domain-containing protein [Clostridia bacterium]